jgi:UDP-N-acetylmuramoyl-tripeptide--D-alanyl-D-alanine ligase
MVAPMNNMRRSAAVDRAAASRGAQAERRQSGRMPAEPRARTGLQSWMTPSAVAKAVGGQMERRGRTASGVVTDTRQDCRDRLFVALRGPNHDGHDHVAQALAGGARGVIVDRDPALVAGIEDRRAAYVVRVEDTGDALLRLAAEHRRRHRARVVGITGSCGKTTTKEWLGAVLSTSMPTVRSPGSYNNSIGVPLTLFQVQPETRAAVVEIGTSAPGEIALLTDVARPDVGIVTCVAAAHLQGLGSVDGVAQEKAQLPQGLAADGLCILNADDVSCRRMAEMTPARVQTVAVEPRAGQQADWFATDLQFHAFGTSFRLMGERHLTLPRLGTHNVYNALFVLAAATELGVSEDDVLAALAKIPPASRRLEPRAVAGITIYDDTYNMNPESARAGLRAIAGIPCRGRRMAVFGEMLELGDESERLHRQLGSEVHAAGIDSLVVVGKGAAPIAEGAAAVGMSGGSIHRVDSVEDALALLLEVTAENDLVLCKASRRVGLDRLVDGFLAQRGRPVERHMEGG